MKSDVLVVPVSFISEEQIYPTINWSEPDRYICIIAEPKGEATNLDAQVTRCLYICTYVRHSQLWTPRSWPFIFITFWILDSGCFRFFTALVAVSSATDWGSQCAIFCPWSPSKSLRPTEILGKMVSVTRKRSLVCEENSMGVWKTLWMCNCPMVAIH